MNRIKKGSMLIEAIASIPIVLMVIIISVRMYVVMNKNVSNEYMNYKNKESLNAICNEIKYNVKFDDLISYLKSKNILINYDEFFLNELIEKDFDELIKSGNTREDNRVEIKLISQKGSSMKIVVCIYYNTNTLKEEIEKGRWMDYV